MRKYVSVLCAMLLAVVAGAQNTSDFNGYWYLGVQGGVAHTVGETEFAKLLSPNAQLQVGYQISPVWGLRGAFSGWQGKGAQDVRTNTEIYNFNYVQGGLDATISLVDIFADYKVRAVNPYGFLGIAGIYGFNNGADVAKLGNNYFEYYWDKKAMIDYRAGAGIDFNITDNLALNLEYACNAISDHLNSKNDSYFDWQHVVLAGLKFSFGKASAKPAPVVAPVPVPVAPAPKPQPEPEPEPEVAPAPVETATVKFEQFIENVFFELDKSVVRTSEMPKIEEIVKVLNENPDAKIKVTGYADIETGTDKRNWVLSQERAENVAKKLIEAGIAKDRITTDYKGSRERVYDTPEKNRVAVCLVK